MKVNKVLEEKIKTEQLLEIERSKLLADIQTCETDKQSLVSDLERLKLEQLENKDRIENLELTRKDLLVGF